MNPKSRLTVAIAEILAGHGMVVESVQVKTADGRTWEIVPVVAGHGRKRDHSWGPIPGTLDGFRLFEIDPECRRGPDEHHPHENADRWYAGDLRDYLAAVTIAPSFSKRCSCDPRLDAKPKSVRVCGWLVCSRCEGRIG